MIYMYLKIDVADVTRKPFPVTSEIYVFYKYFENASRNSLSLYLRYFILMVLEINKAIMYLKIRSSFTITKKKRKNTPNVPELGGMTHIRPLDNEVPLYLLCVHFAVFTHCYQLGDKMCILVQYVVCQKMALFIDTSYM